MSANLSGSTFSSCSAATSGGAVMAPAVSASSTTFLLCSAQEGGALFSANAALSGCAFSLNNASRGGAVAVTQAGGSVQAASTTFQGCLALSGGSLYVKGSSSGRVAVSLADSVIAGSLATAITPHGGAVTAFFASVSLANTTVTGCSVTVLTPQLGPFDVQRDLSPFGSGAGGGLFLYATDLAISRGSQVSFNSANFGGGLYLAGRNSSLRVDGSRFANNTASATHGGAMYLDNIASASILGATFFGNAALVHGGAAIVAGVASTTLSNVTAAANKARTGSGGVLYADENCTALSVSASSFTANEAVAGPVGFLFNWARLGTNGSAPTVREPQPCTDCALAENKASAWGGDALFATDIISARLHVTPAVISSGAQITAVVQLFDGACFIALCRHMHSVPQAQGLPPSHKGRFGHKVLVSRTLPFSGSRRLWPHCGVPPGRHRRDQL